MEVEEAIIRHYLIINTKEFKWEKKKEKNHQNQGQEDQVHEKFRPHSTHIDPYQPMLTHVTHFIWTIATNH